MDKTNPSMHVNDITAIVIDTAIAVHKALGAGLLESVYEVILAHELRNRGLECQRQVPLPIRYSEIQFEEGFRIDILVEDKVILEVKSVEITAPVHKKQVLTYLRLADKQVGLLINFGEELLKDGITRLVNNFAD